MIYFKNNILSKLSTIPERVSSSEVERAILELELGLVDNFGVPFENKATIKAKEDLTILNILLTRTVEHEKRQECRRIKNQLVNVDPNTIISIMNYFKDVDERLIQFKLLLNQQTMEVANHE